MDRNQEQVFNLLSTFADICDSENIWYSLSYGSVLGAVRHNGFIPWDSDADVIIRGDQLENAVTILQRKLPENMRLYTFGEKTKYALSNLRIGYKDGNAQRHPYVDVFILMSVPDDGQKAQKKIRRCKRNGRFFPCKYKNVLFSKKKNIIPILCLKPIAFLFSDKKISKKYFSEINEQPIEKSKYICSLSCYYGEKECFKSETVLNRKLHVFENRELYIPENYHVYLSQLYGDYMVPRKY